MNLSQSEWPEPKGTHIRVLAHTETDTHSFNYTEDGILSIGVDLEVFPENAELPPYVKKSAGVPGYVALNPAGVAALREVLNSIEQQAS